MNPFRNPRNPPRDIAPPTAEQIADSPLIRDLAAVLNTHSAEHLSDTPDFVLASYLNVCLLAFSRAVGARDRWLGRNPFPMQDPDQRTGPIADVEMTGEAREKVKVEAPVNPAPVRVKCSHCGAEWFNDPSFVHDCPGTRISTERFNALLERLESDRRELGALAGHLHRQRNVLDETVRILIVSIENRVSAQPGEIVARLKKLREQLAPDTEPMKTKES